MESNNRALEQAVYHGDVERVEAALQTGCRPGKGSFLLHEAIQYCHPRIAIMLMDAGADVNEMDDDEQFTPLIYAAIDGRGDLCAALCNRGAGANVVCGRGLTPLSAAIASKCTHTIEVLIKAGADVNFRANRYGLYPIEQAVEPFGDHAVRILLAAGAKHASGFHLAIREDLYNIADLFMGWPGFDINVYSYDGTTPLFEVAARGDINLARRLIGHGANPDLLCNGETALHYAARNDNYDMADILVECGANVNAVDVNGQKPVDLAARRSAIYTLLISI